MSKAKGAGGGAETNGCAQRAGVVAQMPEAQQVGARGGQTTPFARLQSGQSVVLSTRMVLLQRPQSAGQQQNSKWQENQIQLLLHAVLHTPSNACSCRPLGLSHSKEMRWTTWRAVRQQFPRREHAPKDGQEGQAGRQTQSHTWSQKENKGITSEQTLRKMPYLAALCARSSCPAGSVTQTGTGTPTGAKRTARSRSSRACCRGSPGRWPRCSRGTLECH